MTPKPKSTKPKPLGRPLLATAAELEALLKPTDADIDAAMAHWLANAPERAKGLLLAQPVDPLGEDNAQPTLAA